VTPTKRAYVSAVVRNYVRLPGTPLRPSRSDRQLAGALHDRGVPLRIVWAAFVLAGARWTIRSARQRQLHTIRTLYYFVPAIDEALETQPGPDYVKYLAAKLRPFVAEKERALATATREATR